MNSHSDLGCTTVQLYNCTRTACTRMGAGGNGKSTLEKPMGMGIGPKVGNGSGGNGNVKSHSRTSLLCSLYHDVRHRIKLADMSEP